MVIFCYDEIKVMLPVEVAWRKLIKRKDTMPSKNQIKKQKTGFTIIEVVLVLAIAGLIFLMVFVALPALQRSQRDTQRRQDYGDLLASMTSYLTNNNNSLPANDTTGNSLPANQYINSTGNGPSGSAYKIFVTECSSNNGTVCKDAEIKMNSNATNTTEGTVRVVKKSTCVNGKPTKVDSTRAFAIYASLETGTYCSSSN